MEKGKLHFPLTGKQKALIAAEAERRVNVAFGALKVFVEMREAKDLLGAISIGVVWKGKKAGEGQFDRLYLSSVGLYEETVRNNARGGRNERSARVEPSLALVKKYELKVEDLDELRLALAETDVTKLMV